MLIAFPINSTFTTQNATNDSYIGIPINEDARSTLVESDIGSSNIAYPICDVDISKIRDFQKSMHYISTQREILNEKGIELDSFDYLDRDKLKGITYNLKTYENIPERDLPLFHNTIGNALQVGCHNGCYHCFVKAPKIAGRYNNAEQLLQWEDFSRFCTDTKELNNRFGFNIFGNGFNRLYTILDSDPINHKMTDKQGNEYNVSDVAKCLYDNLGLSYVFSTAGWEIDDNYAKNSAKDICDTVLARPEIFDKVEISIHPFQEKMKKANDSYFNYLKYADTDKDLSDSFYQDYLDKKEVYVDRMAHVLKEFIPIMDSGKFTIDPQYSITTKVYPYSKAQSEEICSEILTRLEEICKDENIDSSIITDEKDINKNQFFHNWREITSIGRDKNFSNLNFPSLFHLEKTDDKNSIVIEPFGSGNFFGDQVIDSIVKSSQKGFKIFDDIVINVDFENGMDALMLKNDLLNETEAKDNLYTKLTSTLDKLSNIDDVSVRFVYKKEDESKSLFASDIEEELQDKYNIKEFIHSNNTEPRAKTEPVNDFKEILNSLDEDKTYEFVKYIGKYIDVNGKLGFLTLNYPLFGYGNVKERMIYLNNITLNDNRVKTTVR